MIYLPSVNMILIDMVERGDEGSSMLYAPRFTDADRWFASPWFIVRGVTA